MFNDGKSREDGMKTILDIWFVDDMTQNHWTWFNSFSEELKSRHRFEVFATVEALFAVLDAGQFPDILFIDYYIGSRFGHEVVAYFTGRPQRPFLIAHSSMGKANQIMLQQGADIMLSKTPGSHVTESILEKIQSESDLFQLLEMPRKAI